ncbi:murein hydrolase activator EnvC family protein [Sphingomonas qilianensis]|uniref:Peptidoglycan DD-metalloendopeptidase family protein n=1 Tax=Sphingomonas qilianensis TaxID=1736690 RepID=A0ABU9XS11_9SPHN
MSRAARRWTAIALACGIALMAASVPAQDQHSRLADAKRQSAAAAARAVALDRQAAGERDQARQARAQEAAVAARIQQAEADIAAEQARIAILRRLIDTQRARLAAKQAPAVRLIAALQSLARRPALISLIQPGSVSDIVHVRAVLATTLPVIRQRTADVRADLARARRLEADAALAAQNLATARAQLERQRLALTRMEAAHRLRARALGRESLFESDRAIALGERARDIVDLMDRLGDQAGVRDSLAALPGPQSRPPRAGESALPIDTVPWSGGNAPYRLPVIGRVVTGFGELSDAGVRSRGLTLACATQALVVAPAAGRVAFAGAFRGYDRIVILDHGDGWTSLVSGLGLTAVRVGDRIGQGAPIGRAAQRDAARLTIELRRRGRAVDMTPLLD